VIHAILKSYTKMMFIEWVRDDFYRLHMGRYWPLEWRAEICNTRQRSNENYDKSHYRRLW